MSTLKLGFRIFLGMPARDLSATDLAVRLPVEVSNPRAIVSGLSRLGVIERTGRQGRESMYRLIPGATLPEDGRIEAAARARQARQKRSAAAVARSIRLLKRIEATNAVKKAKRVRRVRA